MIHTNRIVTVGEQECIIDRPIVLYRGDREVEIEFTLVGNEFMFSEEGNVIKSVNASHGQLVLNTPSGEHMFSELAECHEGKVVFVVTKEMIDEFIEMGFYSFQIRLYDSAEMKSRVTIPPVMNGFDIRNPIAAEDETNVVDQGIVDYARIFKDQSNEELTTFTWDGEYVKTEWAHHDAITENKMNKIEDALYSINANIKESDVVMLNTLDQVKKDADAYVKEHMAEVEADVEEFERNLNTGVEQFKIDTNAAMTAHKNEVSEELEGFSGELESVNSQLAQIENIIVSLDNFERLNNEADDSGRILRALEYCRDNKGKLVLPKLVKVSSPILLKSFDKIEGLGKTSTIIKVMENFEGQFIIGFDNDEVERVDISNFKIEGDLNLPEYDGINFTNKYSEWDKDPYHVIKNISVEKINGNGIVIKGRGGTICDDIQIKNVNKTGIICGNYDSYYSNMSVGLCKDVAIDITHGPQKMINCKGWGSKIGMSISSKNHALSSIAVQENTHNGIIIDGKYVNISCNVDGVGWDFNNNVIIDDVSAIVLTENASNNNIRATISNGMFDNRGHNDTISYAVKNQGYHNIIECACDNITKSVIDPVSNMETNKYSITGNKTLSAGSIGLNDYDLFSNTSLISTFPFGITYTPIANNRVGFPEDAYGTLITYKTANYSSGNLFNYQEYVIRKSQRKYMRFTQDDNAWSNWISLPSNKLSFTKSTEQTAINANSTVSLTITGLDGADSTINKDMFSITPATFPPAGLVWSAIFVSNNAISIRIANVTSKEITLPSTNWNINFVK